MVSGSKWRKVRWPRHVGGFLALLALFGLIAGGAAAAARAKRGAPTRARHALIAAGEQPWQNPTQPPSMRADELLSALSTDQKIQLALGNFSAVQGFGVPALNFTDGPDGVRNPGTTAMPSGQALAASFDRTLAFEYGQVVGAEARGEGFNAWVGPAVDIARTPLAGRQPEAEGEDPFLAGHVKFELHPSDVAFFNTGAGRWTVAPGRYTAFVGTSSADNHHYATFHVGR
jgi:Glycosyl hydrolase family 3 N terminal domain/Fibronectin type III-like domain